MSDYYCSAALAPSVDYRIHKSVQADGYRVENRYRTKTDNIWVFHCPSRDFSFMSI